jgi:phosphopentomutase
MKSILIILDSCGVGALPDAAQYDPEPGNTIGNLSRAKGGLYIPLLESMGIGKLTDIQGVSKDGISIGAFGKMASQTHGKDTTAGHWEMMGAILDKPLRTFPQGFPQDLIAAFQKQIGRNILGNKVASGTAIIAELGAEHMETGFPIVYTSADSVFQIAAHEEIVPLETLYEWCRIARNLLKSDWAVGRVIARPFIGHPGNFTRTSNRHDFSLDPVAETVLDLLTGQGQQVIGVGKIKDIFNGRGITESFSTTSNADGVVKTLEAMDRLKEGLIFTNLVDFDMLYGHRNDPTGYGLALEAVDSLLKEVVRRSYDEDFMLMISADHGNDPTTPDTDHNREYVPILVCGAGIKANQPLGIRETFADVAATIAQRHQAAYNGPGQSFYNQICEKEN